MSEKELWFYLDKNGVAREYDRSMDLTINFEDREAMEDFEEWLQHEGAEARHRDQNQAEHQCGRDRIETAVHVHDAVPGSAL